MLIQILQHTPPWVFILLLALLALGFSRTRDRQVSLNRLLILPAVMAIMALSGIINTFGASVGPIAAFACGMLATIVAAQMVTFKTLAYDADTGQLTIPGSWVPMLLVIGIFAVKYTVNVQLGLHPDLARDSMFASFVGLAYGVIAGRFAVPVTRAMRSIAGVRGGASQAGLA